MYESYFQLSRRPFAFAPQAEYFFPGRTIEAARQTLTRCIDRGEGIGSVIGPSGTGKSLLLQVLARHFRNQFNVALLSNSHLPSRRALLQVILFELGLPYRGLDEGELRLSLVDYLGSGRSPCMLLLMDEAHLLPIRLLEEVRMIANLVRDGQPQVRLVLAGNTSLEERLASPKLTAFSQRLSARCYIESFDRAETFAFIRAQFAAAGASAVPVFTDGALEHIYSATDGIPRLINQLCDHSLVLAFAGGKTLIDEAGINEAWADLQQLPTPWNETTQVEADAKPDPQVVEFGVLGDDEPAAIRFADAQPAVGDIEEVLNDAPMISQQPEISLVISHVNDPFSESFAEEEVVMNPYAAIDEHRLTRHRVKSDEGKQLSALLEPFLQEAAISGDSPSISLATTFASPSAAEVVQFDSFSSAASANTFISTPAFDSTPRGTIEFGISQNDSAPQHELSLHDDAPYTIPAAAPSENDIMIVEEEPTTEVTRTISKLNPVARRQEYRQLFAQLRRG